MADERFCRYLDEVERELSDLTGGELTSINDLPDFGYRAYYDSDISAARAAKAAVDAAGGF